MKMRVFTLIIMLVFGSIVTTNAIAVSLTDVYQQALVSDPTFKAARSQWFADRENLPIKRSILFPQISATGGFSRNYASSGNNNHYNNQSAFSLNLSQSLFNFGNWANIMSAQAIVKKAEVTFLAAAEDLLLRTATAYFRVLRSKDVLSYTKANKEALANTLNQTKHKYDVGLIAIVDLENARADYDNAIAEEIAAKNDLADKLEQLNAITGVRYSNLDPVKTNFPLLSPQPADINRWARTAEQQNFDLAAARYAAIAARENIKIQNAGHLPVLNATGGYTYNHSDNNPNYNTATKQHQASAGLNLELPIFQGGYVLASAKQANYQYQTALANQEIKHRSTTSSTRQAYLNVLSGVSKIKANKQAIKSANNSLRATKAGYEVGTRTMVDVLQAQAKLYDRQKEFATSQYEYIIQLLTLKQLAGILDANDLVQINSWLNIPITKETPVKKPKTTTVTTHSTQAKTPKKTTVTNKTNRAQVATKKPDNYPNKKTRPAGNNITNTNQQPKTNGNIKITSTSPVTFVKNATVTTQSLNN